MLDRTKMAKIINTYAETLGEEAMAAIAEQMLSIDVDVSDERVGELERLLQEEKDGRAADKEGYDSEVARIGKEYRDKINKFVYGGQSPDEPEDEGDTDEPPVDTEEEVEDLYDALYGKE